MATPACYTCFDGDTDINSYWLMKAWHENGKIDFSINNVHDLVQARDSSTEETIKRSLRLRLNSSDVFIVLVGNSTRYLYKFVRWEIEVAIEKGLPIIVANLDKKRSINSDLCPPILRDHLAIHVAFGSRILNFAIQNWPKYFPQHKAAGKSGPFYYEDSIYTQLGY